MMLIPAMGMQAQIINKSNKDKIKQDVKEGIKDALDAIKQDTHPTGEHGMWDGFVAPKLGVGVSSLPGAGGKPEIGVVGGAYVEVFVRKNLGLSFEITYQHQGGNSLKFNQYVDDERTPASGKYDYDLDYINTSYLAHWYPWPYRPMSFYAGLQLSRLINAKAHKHGGSTEGIRDKLFKGEFDIPVGVSYEMKQWEFDLRYFISPRKLAKSRQAKDILGNARNMMLSLTVAYRIQVF